MPTKHSKVALLTALLFASLGSSMSHANEVNADPMACTDEELQAYFDNYKAGLKEHIAMTPKPDYNQIKKADIARRAVSGDDDDRAASLCAIITTPDFNLQALVPDLSFISDAYAAMKVWYASDSAGGVDYATLISEGVAQGMEYAKKEIKKGYCKFARSLPSKIDAVAYDLYETTKKEGASYVLAQDAVKELGVTNFKKPVWQQMAGEQLDQQLEDYSDYAKWYEDGWSVEDAVGGASGDWAEGEIDENTDSWLDELEDSDPLIDGGVPYL